MLPSLTPGCTSSLHPDVKDGNMGVYGNERTVPDNKNQQVLPILQPFFLENDRVICRHGEQCVSDIVVIEKRACITNETT